MLSFRVGVRISPYLAATPECLTAKIHNWEHSWREQETQGHFHYLQRKRINLMENESPLPKGDTDTGCLAGISLGRKPETQSEGWAKPIPRPGYRPSLNISLEKLYLNLFQSLLQNQLLHLFRQTRCQLPFVTNTLAITYHNLVCMKYWIMI